MQRQKNITIMPFPFKKSGQGIFFYDTLDKSYTIGINMYDPPEKQKEIIEHIIKSNFLEVEDEDGCNICKIFK